MAANPPQPPNAPAAAPPAAPPTPPASGSTFASKSPSDTGLQWLKEIIVATLTLATFGVLVCFFFDLTRIPTKPDRPQDDRTLQAVHGYEQARTDNTRKVIDSLLPLFSALVGYYVGRIPAEKAAAASQQVAQQKTGEAAQATARADNAAAQLTSVTNVNKQAIDLLNRTRSLGDAVRAQVAAADPTLPADIKYFLDKRPG